MMTERLSKAGYDCKDKSCDISRCQDAAYYQRHEKSLVLRRDIRLLSKFGRELRALAGRFFCKYCKESV